jgi:hypothetical protein
MKHIHAREYLEAGTSVRVDCDHQCNVMIMDDTNYAVYRRGGRATCYGGHFRRLPALIEVPRTGFWNTVIDLGGGNATIRYNISYLG